MAFGSGDAALQQVCARPPSHDGVVRAVRDLNWKRLDADHVPGQIAASGMTWSEVVESPDGGMLVAVTQLSGTSFCRVYVRKAQTGALRTGLERTPVLGAPLGRPDFHRRTEAETVVGWHRTLNGQWRAVHMTVVDPKASAGPMRIVLEMTRAAG